MFNSRFDDTPWHQTPFFMFNSRFDEWQLLNELQTGSSRQQMAPTPALKTGILGYGKSFMTQVAPVGGAGSANGGFITTCICHGCPWADLVLQNKTADQHSPTWFYGIGKGVDAIHIDTRPPNGGGTFDPEVPGLNRCDPFK